MRVPALTFRHGCAARSRNVNLMLMLGSDKDDPALSIAPKECLREVADGLKDHAETGTLTCHFDDTAHPRVELCYGVHLFSIKVNGSDAVEASDTLARCYDGSEVARDLALVLRCSWEAHGFMDTEKGGLSSVALQTLIAIFAKVCSCCTMPS